MATRARRFNYLLRPSKQVERKLILECMHRLAEVGYRTSEYRYLGFGSIYYADFLLFRRYLYIDDMVCFESGGFAKSMHFNRPFDSVQVELRPIGDYVQSVDRTRRHLVWLDYDYDLNSAVLQDIAGFVTVLAPGSVLIVTVKATPPEPDLPGEEESCRDTRRSNVLARITADLGTLAPTITLADLTRPRLAELLGQVIREQANIEGSRRRDSARFHQLFAYRYADNAHMVTIGGLIESEQQFHAVDAALTGWPFARLDPAAPPLEISVPSLTVREKNWLDQRLAAALSPGKLEFDLEKDELEAFRRFYREYPSYFESLL